jgi:hypothetical protein
MNVSINVGGGLRMSKSDGASRLSQNSHLVNSALNAGKVLAVIHQMNLCHQATSRLGETPDDVNNVSKIFRRNVAAHQVGSCEKCIRDGLWAIAE